MDMQAVLRQKDAELEQRATLLLKTKAAIEQLQEELGSTREDVERWRKAAERQASELADAQRQVAVLEAELEAKGHESSTQLSDNLALKRKLQEVQDALQTAADCQSEERGGLLGKLREAEHALAAAQADAEAQREQARALQALAAQRDHELTDQASALQQAVTQRGQHEANATALREQLAAVQRQQQEAAAQADAVQSRTAASMQQLEARLAAEAEARQRAEYATAAAREALADEQRRHSLDIGAWERRLRELQEDSAERLQTREAGWATQREAAAREAAATVEDVRRQLTKRLYLAEGEWAKKLQNSSAEWATKLDAQGAEWAQRVEVDRVAWAEERQRLQEEAEGRLAEADRAHTAAVEEVRRHYRRKVAAAQSRAVAEAEAADRAWQQHVEAAVAEAESKQHAATDSWASAAAQREHHLITQVAAAQAASAAKLAEVDKQWALKLAAAEEKADKERQELQRQCGDRLAASERSAVEALASLRAQLEARLVSVLERVGGMVQKENRQEQKRAELARQLAELEVAGEGERGRRRAAEAALREASSIFKRELADKNQQLDLLRQEIRFLRSCAGSTGISGRAVIGLPSTVSPIPMPLPYFPTAAAAMAPSSPTCAGSPCAAAAASCCHFSPPFQRCGMRSSGGAGGPVQGLCTSFSAPASPAVNSAAAADAAARAIEAEVKALRSARRAYQRATLGQQELCASMVRGMHEALQRQDGEPGDAAAAAPLSRPHSAGTTKISGYGGSRRKWRRDLAAELSDVGGTGSMFGVEASAEGEQQGSQGQWQQC